MDNDFTLPKLRENIVFREFEENSEKYVVIADVQEYSPQNLILPISFLSILQLYDGNTTISEIEQKLKEINAPKQEEIIQQILNLYYLLDSNLYLETPLFFSFKQSTDEYNTASIRPSILSGNTFPKEKNKLNDLISSVLANNKVTQTEAKALIVPHIDLNIGKQAEKCYGMAYNSIANTNANLFIILGTAHNVHKDYFMLTRKDFQTPLGIAKTDNDLIDELEKELSFKLNIDDKLHRFEHSIEIQIPFIQYLSNGKDFTILPIIAGSLHDFYNNDILPKDNEKIIEFIRALSNLIIKQNKKPMFIASADLAHIGRRFDDDFDAETELEKLKHEDFNLLKLLEKCDSDSFFKVIKEKCNHRKVCGLSPIYHLLSLFKPTQCKILAYEQWNDLPTKSAVSFASLALY